MPSANNRDEFILRKNALWAYLCENNERELDWNETKLVIATRTKTHEPSDPQLEYCIRQLRKELHAPNEIKVVGVDPTKHKDKARENARIILHHRESESSRREREATEQKQWMGSAAWFVLLGKYSDEEVTPPWVVVPRTDLWPVGTSDRLRSLRQRTHVSLAMDSGSTIRSLARSLVASAMMPFEAFDIPAFRPPSPSQRSQKANPRHSRLVLPSLITNSPSVVTDILESVHYNRLDLRLIGGSVGGDSAATTGGLAESCLAAWGYAGQFVGVDIAIVGTRGYMEDAEGQMGFMVSHLSQASMKARFFSMAATKCVVMASSKLKHPEGVCRFARLNSTDVHMVFTDAMCVEDAAKLFLDGLANGVVVVIAAEDKRQAHEVEEAVNRMAGDQTQQDKAATSVVNTLTKRKGKHDKVDKCHEASLCRCLSTGKPVST